VITGETAAGETVYDNALLAAMKKNIITTLMDTVQNRRLGNYDVNDITIGVTTLADEAVIQTSAEVFMLMYFNNAALDILIIKNKSVVMARSAQLDAGITAGLNKTAGEPVSDELYEELLEIIKNEFMASANFYSIKNKEEITKVYFYASSFDIKKSLHILSSELDTDFEPLGIDYKLDPAAVIPPEKYLGCISIAAGKL
jgi:hypothetical protein